MESVYIETSVPSYYFETRTSIEARVWRRATRRWWTRYRFAYSLSTSDVTLEELRRAPPAKGTAALKLLSAIRVLDPDEKVARVAQYYLDHRLVPRRAIADAFHVAIASCHAIDYVLTWNIRHLANPNKAKHLAVLNARLMLPTPTLITPLTLLPETLA